MMSESYPRSKIWPFVVLGILLFGMVLVPPSRFASQLRQIYQEMAEQARVGTSSAPKITVGHDPGKRKNSPGDSQLLSIPAIAPSPLTNVSKSDVASPKHISLDANLQIHDTAQAPDLETRESFQASFGSRRAIGCRS